MTKVIVKFVKPWRQYQPGEKAGFLPELATDLIKAGKAIDPNAVAEPAPTGDDTATKPAAKPAAPKGKTGAKGAPPKQGGKPAAEPAPTGEDTTGGAAGDDTTGASGDGA